jgi:DNA-binding transcriptional regulator YiaG
MTTKRSKTARAIRGDVPYTAKLPDGHTLFVLVPAKWCELSAGGEVLFKPEASRFIDRIQTLAMRTPAVPTPGYVRTLREALGLTQAELGERLGVDKATVARWENGKVRPGRKAASAMDKLRRQSGRRGTTVAA